MSSVVTNFKKVWLSPYQFFASQDTCAEDFMGLVNVYDAPLSDDECVPGQTAQGAWAILKNHYSVEHSIR
jgi:hypothetical protein